MRVAIQVPLLCVTLLFLWSGEASADRVALPTTAVCNTSKKKIYVATAIVDTYTGWQQKGWTYVKPKSCSDFQSDAFHFRGSHKVLGLSKRKIPGCVTDQKVFSIIMGSWDATKSPAKCKAEKGRVVQFTYPKAGRKVRLVVK